MEEENKKLSEEEINKIARMVVEQIEADLYLNIGSGLVSLVWKGIIMGILAIAAYGFFGHFGK